MRGDLADLPLPDLLQIIAMNRKSGKLRVASPSGDGLVVFRDGKIVYGATDAHRESFGSALLLRGLVSAEQLVEAIRRKTHGHGDRRLGSVLVEMGAVSEADLRDVLRAQLREVMVEILRWTSGTVDFDEIDLALQGEVAVDSEDFVMREGLSASGILLALVEEQPEVELTEGQQFLADLGWVARPPGEAPSRERSIPPGALGDIIDELPTPLWSGETALAILGAGAAVVARGLLLLRSGDGFRGLGQFGIWPVEQMARVRDLRIAHQSRSLITDVARSKQAFRGAPGTRPHDLMFFRFLDCDPPPEVIVLPVVVGGEVQLLFYGDNLPDKTALASTAALERLLLEVGRATDSARHAAD